MFSAPKRREKQTHIPLIYIFFGEEFIKLSDRRRSMIGFTLMILFTSHVSLSTSRKRRKPTTSRTSATSTRLTATDGYFIGRTRLGEGTVTWSSHVTSPLLLLLLLIQSIASSALKSSERITASFITMMIRNIHVVEISATQPSDSLLITFYTNNINLLHCILVVFVVVTISIRHKTF